MSHQLDRELQRLAAPVELPRGDVGAVVERAQHRRRRARAGVALFTAVSLSVAAFAVVEVARRNDGSNTAQGNGTVISLGAPKQPAKPLVWKQVPVSSALGLAGAHSAGTGPIYALSTAPGESKTDFQRNTVYRSVDGIDWNEVASPGNDLFLSDLAPTDNRVYAVGTGPATADPKGTIALYAGASDDGAKTWAKQKLPLDLGAISKGDADIGVDESTIASSARGSVITARLGARLNVASLLPAGVHAPNGYTQTNDGIQIFGPEKPCPAGTSATPANTSARSKSELYQLRAKATGKLPGLATVKPCFRPDGSMFFRPPIESHEIARTFTWHDLGVTGDLLAAVRGDEFVFAAEPGSTDFVRVPVPQLENAASVALTANADGFDLVAAVDVQYGTQSPTGRMVALHSNDGRTWTESDNTPTRIDNVYGVGRLDGQIVVFASRGGTTPAVFLRNASGGWTMTSLADVVGDAAPAGTTVGLVDGAVGPFGLVAEVIVTPEVQIGGPKKAVPPPTSSGFILLTSPDGVSWSKTALDSLAGSHSSIERLDAIGDHVVVVATVAPSDDSTTTLPATGSASTKAPSAPNPGQKKVVEIAFVGTPGS